MTRTYRFTVAQLTFAVTMPSDWNAPRLLPSFGPFICREPDPECIFALEATASPYSGPAGAELLTESTNDMGHVHLWRQPDGSYLLDMSYGTSPQPHVLTCDAAFTRATAHIHPADPSAAMVLTSMLRFMMAQAVIAADGVSIHASCVDLHGSAYLFLGKSGTGKSTHARQWLAAFPGCQLINDDNPIIRIISGTPTVFGTPWSGKTPCYRSVSRPVAGIVRLQQAPANSFTPLAGPEAFAALLPSCSSVRQDPAQQLRLHATLIALAEAIPVARLACLPHPSAAHLCHSEIISREKQRK